MMTKEPEKAKYLVFHVMTTSQSLCLLFQTIFSSKNVDKKDSNTIKLFELYLLSTSFLSQGDLCIKEKEYLCLLICNEIKEEYAEIWASQVALVVKNSPTNAGNMRCEFDPWVWKIPWRRAWPPSPVFLPGESH